MGKEQRRGKKGQCKEKKERDGWRRKTRRRKVRGEEIKIEKERAG